MLDAWYGVLKDIPIEFITAAAEELLKTSKWMPRPAEVLEAASLLWRRDLEAKERMSRVRLTYSDPGKPMTREGLREMIDDIGTMGGNVKQLDAIGQAKWEREREQNKQRTVEASL